MESPPSNPLPPVEHPPLPPSAPAPAPKTPPPRAFAQGTGVMLQVVGMILFLSTCCVCSSSDSWEPPLSTNEMQEKLNEQKDIVITVRGMFRDPATTGLSMMVVFSTVGGLALAVFGLGLQTDKPRAGWAALITAIIWLLVLIVAGVCLWIGGASWFAKLWNLFLLVLAVLAVVFTAAALRQVRANPPPPGMDILPKDFEIPRSYRH